MAAVVETSPDRHSPPPPTAKRPRGILKNSYQKSPPRSPTKEQAAESDDANLSAKEVTIHNTQVNAGHRRSSSAAGRPAGSRRQSTRDAPDADHPEGSQRLQWDEANLYLTEQERSPKMKIDEPKTPYAKHYDPSEDPDGDDYMTGGDSGHHEIPGPSLGEPEEDVPLDEFAKKEKGMVDKKGEKAVHVSEDGSSSGNHDADELDGLTAEEIEKHHKFEEMRKKHYEMKNVAQLLGHPEDLEEAEEEDGGGAPANGRAA